MFQPVLITGLVAVGLLMGCSDAGTISNGSSSTTGGAVATESGGTSSGGAPAATGGATPSTGGASATGGGSPTTGGASAGGQPTSGGTPSAGAPGSEGGSTSATGGDAAGGAVSTGGDSSAAGGSVAPPAVSCSTPLADRVTTTSIAVSPSVVVRGRGINSVSLPVILSTAPSGGSKVAWSDGTSAHVTPLDASDQRAGDDIVIEGIEVRGFVAHDDGSAILVVRDDAMVFVLLDQAGTEMTSLDLVGNVSHDQEGSRWIDDWPHQGRLAWSGSEYAAYFGQTGNHGAAGNHQGDHYSRVSAAGELVQGGWDWGCSHSLDDRIAHNGTGFAPICISDTYPGSGIFFNNRVEVSHEPSVTNVGGVAKLGGLLPAPDGFYLTFTSPEDRESSDVVFIHVADNGMASGRAYLTDTPGVDEGYSHLAAYGEQLLAGWEAGGEVTLAVIDAAGAVLEGPAATGARIGGQDDFATFANGDAGWAAAWDDLGQIQVVRVARCQDE